MKNIKIYSFLFLLLAILSGCKEDDILFESEKPYFPVREGYQLIEVIVPVITAQTDQIYITGEFNGGEEAIGDPMWLLEKASNYPYKFGIYLDPSTFINGKTLADGYTFYNVQRGEERTLKDEPILHFDAPKTGERLNVLVDAWEDSFVVPDNPDDVEHDGYAIYVIDETGYSDLALYAWGNDIPEIFGGWPGVTPTGRIELNGIMYKYFDTGAENEGLNVNLIFNNNGGGEQLPDFNVTLNKDYYLEVTSEGVIEFDPNASIEHDGYTVYVYNNTGWDLVTLYMWGDVNDLNGGWPGMLPTGTISVNGLIYLYYDMGEANSGLAENLIFSNNGENQLGDFGFTIDRDIYLEISAVGVVEIDPNNFTPGEGGGGDTPEDPNPGPGEVQYLYVVNQTGWNPLYLYTWNSDGTELCGGWPGISSTDIQEIQGVSYTIFEVPSDSDTQNLIFNDGIGGETGIGQTDSFGFVLDKDYYLNVTSSSITEIDAPEVPIYHLYVDNKTGWENFYVYGWGNDLPELFGGWPGTSTSVTETIEGVEYLVFDFKGTGETYNLIFNANVEGVQYDALQITLDKDYYVTANPDKAILKD
ncbi:MAG: starch-binding protein [Muribaculaceae bacterium]|nr:starch-binding protein [Muribaculaceae bacterium]